MCVEEDAEDGGDTVEARSPHLITPLDLKPHEDLN